MFADRKDAALKLAVALSSYRNQHAIVLGIPRGGVEIAYYVAAHLNAEFALIITRKLGHPSNPEAAFGAITEDGSIYLSEETSGTLSEVEINKIVEREKKEIQRRIRILRKGKRFPDIRGKTVIIVDDGIATGATLFTAISMCKKRNPLKIIVAVPIADQQMKYELQRMVDDVIILETPLNFYAVGQGYLNFENLTDEQAIEFVDAWENRGLKNAS